MESRWVPFLIVLLMFTISSANGYYSARVGGASLKRELLVRITLVELLFGFPIFLTGQVLPSIALSLLVLLPIIALVVLIYPAKRKYYRAIYDQRARRERQFQNPLTTSFQ